MDNVWSAVRRVSAAAQGLPSEAPPPPEDDVPLEGNPLLLALRGAGGTPVIEENCMDLDILAAHPREASGSESAMPRAPRSSVANAPPARSAAPAAAPPASIAEDATGIEEDEWASNPLAVGGIGGGIGDAGAFGAADDDGFGSGDWSNNPLANAAASSAAAADAGADSAGADDDFGEDLFASSAATANPLAQHSDLTANADDDAEFSGNAMEVTPRKASVVAPATESKLAAAPSTSDSTAVVASSSSGAAAAGSSSSAPASSPVPNRTEMSFDIYVFLVIFFSVLLPFLGLSLYELCLAPEVRKRAAESEKHKADKKTDKSIPDEEESDDEDTVSRAPSGRSSPRTIAARKEAKAVRRAAAAASSLNMSKAPLANFASSSVGTESTEGGEFAHSSLALLAELASSRRAEPLFDWTWEGAIAAFKASFPLVSKVKAWWTAEGGLNAEEQAAHVRAVLLCDKKYVCHPRFQDVALRHVSVGLGVLVLWFLLVEDVHFSLKSALLYALRFHVCAVAAFAAVCSVHSSGLVPGYKAVLAQREKELQRLRMRFVLAPTEEEKASGAPPSGRLHSSNALQVFRAIDSLSKRNKPLLVERRMVWILVVCAVRALVGIYAAWAGGSGFVTSILYGVFHLMSGFCYFALAVQTEFELHEDETRWLTFSAIHSASLCQKLGLPFHVPLAHLGKSNNIQAWYAIRCYIKDLKGKFDFARMEVLLVFMFVQLASSALLPVWYSFFQLGHSAPEVYQHVFGSNPLVAFDTALCLFLLLDMVAAGVAINRICGSHSAALQEQEMQRAFALTNKEAREGAGGEQAVADSIQQLKALRERLTLHREVEKLRLFGAVALDEHITTYLRTALVSYGLVAAQSLFTRAVIDPQAATKTV